MEGFEIRVGVDFIHVWPEEIFIDPPDQTSLHGGYDIQIQGKVEIQCRVYHTRDPLQFSVGDILQFYTDLLKAYNDLAGNATFQSTDGELQFTIAFESHGHLAIEGTYEEVHGYNTLLQFAMNCDQTYLIEPLAQLTELATKYRDKYEIAT